MTEQTMTPDEVLARLSKIASPNGSLYTAVAALIARNAELEAASIGRDLGEVHALIAENSSLTSERDAYRDVLREFQDGRRVHNPHTRQVARDIEQQALARAEAGSHV